MGRAAVVVFFVSSSLAVAFSSFHRSLLQLLEVTSQGRVWHGEASVVLEHPQVEALSACVWSKSMSLEKGGTLMSFYGEDNDLRWGIVTLRSNLGRGHNQQLQIVVDGGVSPEVIVRLNDVIWHHLCMTWNRTGDWQFFMDGRKVSKGKQLGVGAKLKFKGRIFFGSGSPNSKDLELVPFIGKLSEAIVYSRVLTSSDILRVADCSNYGLLSGSKIGAGQDPTIIYRWLPNALVTKWPAAVVPGEDFCENKVTVECAHNHMIISMSNRYFPSLPGKDLHLDDPSCIPIAIGNRLVFNVINFNSCGTQQNVRDGELVYSNHVSNLPHPDLVLFRGVYQQVEVQCHYPIDLTVSTAALPSETHFTFRTQMQHPLNREPDLEALTFIYEDKGFVKAFDTPPHLHHSDSFYVGLIVKNKTTGIPVNDVNVVVDSCEITSSGAQKQIFNRSSCWMKSDDVTILENGQRSQARMRIAANALFGTLPSEPQYLKCSAYPCIGSSCASSCGKIRTERTVSSQRGDFDSMKNRMKKRDIYAFKVHHHDITIGPLYLDIGDRRLNQHLQDNIDLPGPLFWGVVVSLLAMALCSLVLSASVFIMKWRQLTRGYFNVTKANDN